MPHMQDAEAQLVVHLGEGTHGVEGDAPGLLLLEADRGRVPIEADADRLQLPREDLAMCMRLAGIQHHEQQICAFTYGDDLPPSPCR